MSTEKFPSHKSWFLPFDPNHYDVKSAFEEQGYIIWRCVGRTFNVGDTAYLYASGNIHRVLYKALVSEGNFVYHSSFDNDSKYVLDGKESNQENDICFKIIPIEENIGNGCSLAELKEFGQGFFAGPTPLGDMEKKVEESFKGRKMYTDLCIDDKVISPKLGTGLVTGFGNNKIIIRFQDGEHELKYPNALIRRIIKKA